LKCIDKFGIFDAIYYLKDIYVKHLPHYKLCIKFAMPTFVN